MVTLGMDLGKLLKSVPLVTIFLIIGEPWHILYISSI